MTDEEYSLQEIGTDEELLSFSGSDEEPACIGHLRGDFGSGTEFWTSWWDHNEGLKSQELKDELNAVVNDLRKDGPLKNLSSMERFCQEHARARMSPKAGAYYYGFRVDTAKHCYYLRLFPSRGNYNFYIYCYQTDKMQRAADLPQKENSMNEQTIRVLVVAPGKPCRVQEISGLEAMQAIVGGPIQAVYPFPEAVALVCNEEGKLRGLPYNRPLVDDRGIPYDAICGTFFLAGIGDEDFVSLTGDQLRRYQAYYDNTMILTAERSDGKTEIAPESAAGAEQLRKRRPGHER